MKLPDNLIGQTSNQQVQEIYDYIDLKFQDRGTILEFGTFLGKVTYCLSIIQNKKKIKNKIFTYDVFLWNTSHKKKFPQLNIKIGQCFMQKTKSIVSNDSIHFIKGDIDKFIYNDYSLIELVILDAPKNFDEIKDILLKINNKLIPGCSKIIFMDFFLPSKYDSILFLYMLKNYGKISFSQFENVFFELDKKIDLDILNPNLIKKSDYFLIEDFLTKIENKSNLIKLQLPMLLLNYRLFGFFSTIRKIFATNQHLMFKKYVFSKSFLKRFYIIFPFIFMMMIYEKIKKKFK
jgi:hypothetical protein